MNPEEGQRWKNLCLIKVNSTCRMEDEPRIIQLLKVYYTRQVLHRKEYLLCILLIEKIICKICLKPLLTINFSLSEFRLIDAEGGGKRSEWLKLFSYDKSHPYICLYMGKWLQGGHFIR